VLRGRIGRLVIFEFCAVRMSRLTSGFALVGLALWFLATSERDEGIRVVGEEGSETRG
jgi:hypothetical protein